MKTPPIPPSCDLFVKTKFGMMLYLPADIVPREDPYIAWCLSTGSRGQRRVIAAVAEVEWRKIAERITDGQDREGFNKAFADVRLVAANENAELWRKWGEA
jgi:hypothetical protein